HDELLTAVWPDVHVQPEVLKTHILAIRTALGDDSSSPKFIETQRGRGYRFIGQMTGLALPEAKPEAALDLGIFAGRAEPMRELLALYEQVLSGEPRAVFISGEPGIGKTTLIEQFLVRARGRLDLAEAQGHCTEGFAGPEPYCPIFEALRGLSKTAYRNRVVRALVELAPSWASELPDLSSPGQGAAGRQVGPEERSRMVRQACTLFEALATEHPLVLVLEDLHWADFATIDFISALCRRRSSAKLMLIGSYRPENLRAARHPLKQMAQDLALHNYCSEIELAPLSTPAISEVLSGNAESEPVSAEFTRFIKERTGGNPLFMRVTLDYLLERGDIARTAQGWRLLILVDRLAPEPPPTLARAIELRIEGMTDEQRRVLVVASVAGEHFDPITLASVAEMDEEAFEASCENLTPSTIRRGELLILPTNQLVRSYTFTHAVYRQALYDRIGPVHRAHLHRKIGERLEEIYPPDQRGDLAVRLAQHFASAREWPKALNYLRSALRIANNRFAHRDALAILDRASELAANLADSARIPAEIELLMWRAATQALANDPQARESYVQLAAKAGEHGDIDTQCRALLGVAARAISYDLAYGLKILDEVLTLSERQADPIQRDLTQIMIYAERARFGWKREDNQKCEALLDHVRRHGDPPTIAWAEANFGLLCLLSTRYQEAHDLLNHAYRVLSETPQSVSQADLSRITWIRCIDVPWSLTLLGELGSALTDLSASTVAVEKSGNPSDADYLEVHRGALLFHAMDYEGVIEYCATVASFSTEHSAASAIQIPPIARRIALIFCGLAEAALENNSRALDYLRTAEREMERQPVYLDWYWRLHLEWGMVNILIAEANHFAAVERAKKLCDLAAHTDERGWQALAWEARARAALSCGDSAEAIEHVAKALAACEEVQVPIAEWRVHATSAIAYKAVGDLHRAKRHTQMSAAVRRRLAESLPDGDPVRLKFERRSASLSAA
ncbi:MAG: transcriptional regulator, putative ATPase, winged helix family, partial [Rhodospirillales bacterium]|nr:transcriptional regulator, putative ATPase, winged helix family [Rhodospirillales bacterium]